MEDPSVQGEPSSSVELDDDKAAARITRPKPKIAPKPKHLLKKTIAPKEGNSVDGSHIKDLSQRLSSTEEDNVEEEPVSFSEVGKSIR